MDYFNGIRLEIRFRIKETNYDILVLYVVSKGDMFYEKGYR